MAFTYESFEMASSSKSVPTKIYSYLTTDTKAQVKASGYFNEAATYLEPDDLLFVVASDETMFLLVDAVTAGVVTTKVGPTNGA